VATHADIMNVPRPAGGEFGYDKDTSLLKEIRNRWVVAPGPLSGVGRGGVRTP
jgi:hypothetical protein